MKLLDQILKAIRERYKFYIPAALAVALIAAAFIAAYAPAGDAVTAAAARRELPIYCVQSADKRASLTFDAAWGNEDTQQLIDILGKYNIKATFFVVGDWARKYPESVKALHDAGHEVMSHSDKHEHMPQLTPMQIAGNLKACNTDIEAVTHEPVTLFRFPYGEYDDTSVKAVRGMGLSPIQWDVDSLDWKDLDAAAITKRVTERVKPGSIVLFHNAAKHTPEALPGIIEKLQSEGYTLVKVSDLIVRDNYTIDHTGKQIKNPQPS